MSCGPRRYLQRVQSRRKARADRGKDAHALHLRMARLMRLLAQHVAQAGVRAELGGAQREAQELGVPLRGGDKTANHIKVIG